MSSRLTKIASALGWDNQSHLLTMAVVRKDQELLLSTLSNLSSPSSLNRSFEWRRLFVSDLKFGTPLELALRFNNLDAVPDLLSKGATWSTNSVSMAALHVLSNPDHPKIRDLIKACVTHGIDWSKGEFFREGRDRLYYVGTAKMVLLDQLEEKAFEMGLFPEKTCDEPSAPPHIISIDQATVLPPSPAEEYRLESGYQIKF